MADATADYYSARTRLLKAAIHALANQVDDEEYAYKGDDAQLADEELALAARVLTDAVNGLPKEEWPVGWVREVKDETVGHGPSDDVLMPRTVEREIIIPANQMPSAWDALLGRPAQPKGDER